MPASYRERLFGRWRRRALPPVRLSVGLSGATWAAIFLILGAQVGDDLQAMVEVHRGLGTALLAIVLGVFVTYLGLRLGGKQAAD